MYINNPLRNRKPHDAPSINNNPISHHSTRTHLLQHTKAPFRHPLKINQITEQDVATHNTLASR